MADRIVLNMADELKRPLRLTPREALRLVLTADAVAEAVGEELPALRSAIDKMRDALGIPERVADVVGEDAATHVSMARDAIAQGRQVRLRYQGRADEDPRDRVVDPWTFVDDLLTGWCHLRTAERTFAVDRIGEATLLATPVDHESP